MKNSIFNLIKSEFNCLELNTWRKSVEYAIPKDNMMNILDYIKDVINVM